MFKPMLAAECTDADMLRFPVLASTKLDGVRATVQGGRLLSRSLKPIPNVQVQAMFAGLPDGLDGELICGDPTAPDAYRKTTSVVMSDDKDAMEIQFHVFDKHGSQAFDIRLLNAGDAVYGSENLHCTIVDHIVIKTRAELDALEEQYLAAGHEGVMLRSLGGPYKEGRSTEKEGYLLKLKQFKDAEATVLGTYELEHNQNAPVKNALGHTERSTAQAGKVAAGVLGGFFVRGVGDYDGVEFKVGGGFDAAMRADFWKQRETLVGKTLKYKYFTTGSKDRPRFPVFLGWRDKADM